MIGGLARSSAIPGDPEKTGKREMAHKLLHWWIALVVITVIVEIWTGAEMPFLRQSTLALFGFASVFTFGAYGISALRQAGVVGSK